MQNQLPRRSKRFGVGKEIGGAVYIHRAYEDRLGVVIDHAKKHLPLTFAYDVVKLNIRTEAISFIECPDFDTIPEPSIGNVLIVDIDGNVRRRRQPRDPEVYHHKWLFVAEDYEGFDVEASRRRSLEWICLDGLDRARLARRSYWDQYVVPQLDAMVGGDCPNG